MSNKGRYNEDERVNAAASQLAQLTLKAAGALDGITVGTAYDRMDDTAADILAAIADVLESNVAALVEGARA
jgi:hypothetical protein